MTSADSLVVLELSLTDLKAERDKPDPKRFAERDTRPMVPKRMRIRLRVSIVFVISFPLASALFAPAQRFTAPSREELQMAADPKAPGAPAVFLYREEVTDNANHYQSTYARIKVFTEKGKEWGTVEVPYEPGIDAEPRFEARTIHADGTVIPLKGKASDLLIVKSGGLNFRTAVFNLPSIEAGSILEYRWTIPLIRPRNSGDEASHFVAAETAAGTAKWDVQQDLYVHKAHFYFNPVSQLGERSIGSIDPPPAQWMKVWSSGFLLYKERLPPGVHVVPNISHGYSLDVTDIPAFQREKYSPPVDDLRYRVWFYLTPFTDPATFWVKERERWLSELNAYASSDPELQKAAAEMVALSDSDETKSRKLYAAVQGLTNRTFESAPPDPGGKDRPRNVLDVWRNKAGDRNDIAALYLALARAAGLKAYGVQVADRSRRIFDPNYLSLIQLDALLVVIQIDGKSVFLDPGEKLCPFGQLAWTHTLAGGLRQDIPGNIHTPGNRAADAVTAHKVDLTLDPHGAVTGKLTFLITGPSALRWRQLSLARGIEESREAIVQSIADLLPAGIVVTPNSIFGLDNVSVALSGELRVSGQLSSGNGQRIVLPAFPIGAEGDDWFVQRDNREAAVDLHFAEQVVDDVTYDLPAGYQVEGDPAYSHIAWPAHAALDVVVKREDRRIQIKRTITRGFTLLDAKDYPAMAEFSGSATRLGQEQIVLTRLAANDSN